MTLDELLRSGYAWADARGATLLLLVGLALPVVGTVAALIGRGGKTDTDGKLIASTIVGFAVLLVMLEIAAVMIGHSVYDRSVLEANAALLFAPITCLVASVVGVRLVFPLNQLASVRTIADMVAFGLACGATIWFFSRFRGWGIVFFGSFLQMVVVVLLGGFFLRRLYRRAFGADAKPSDSSAA